jgi:hypothetical protein
MKRMVVYFGFVLTAMVIGMGTNAYAGPGPTGFICGDVNHSGVVDSMDIAYILDYVFAGGPAPRPLASGDVNRDGRINAGDAVYLISYLYRNGPPPACAEYIVDTTEIRW